MKRAVAILLASLLLVHSIGMPTRASQRGDDRKSERLVLAEKSADDGWLRKYDYNQHRDVGDLMRVYWKAYKAGDPEQLVRHGYAKRSDSISELKARWASESLTPEDEPFAVDVVATNDDLRVSVCTRVLRADQWDTYWVDLMWKKRRWRIDIDRLVNDSSFP